jgi:hypothetical protein
MDGTEDRDSEPCSWKPLGLLVSRIVHGIERSRLLILEREQAAGVVTVDLNRESGLRRTGQGKGRVLGDDAGEHG